MFHSNILACLPKLNIVSTCQIILCDGTSSERSLSSARLVFCSLLLGYMVGGAFLYVHNIMCWSNDLWTKENECNRPKVIWNPVRTVICFGVGFCDMKRAVSFLYII